MNLFEQHVHQGEEYLKASRPDLAVPEFKKALELAPTGAAQMHLNNTLARVLELEGDREQAKIQFRQTLESPNTGEAAILEQMAIAFNNLGRLSLPQDPGKAIEFFEEAIEIYEDLRASNPGFQTHLAHTLMARGESYYLRNKYWYSKKDYKAAIDLRENDNNALSDEMLALAHYQLGAIYADEFNAHDARSNYQKALRLYSKAMESDPAKFRPLVAACMNNLAVVLIQLDEYDKAALRYEDTLQHYKILSAQRPEVFRPYQASTYANIGVLLADKMHRYSEAFQANENAISLYEELANIHPDRYTHYLATAYHNAGIYTLETPVWQKAEPYLSKSLAIRRDLEKMQPGSFGADFCATALNLMEFYQRKLEVEKDFSFKEKGLALLSETSGFLGDLPELPATQNMKSDFGYFENYFNAVDEEELRTLDILQKIRQWDQEIDSTLVVAEKAIFQAKILGILKDFYRDFPDNKVLKKPYVLALNNRAWLHLCEGQVPEARQLLEEGAGKNLKLPALECNLAHCDLLEDRTGEAIGTYRELFGTKNESGKDFREVIEKDLQKLESYGVLPSPSGAILASMGMPAGGSVTS
ncbi:MAG: tetratricopeptide repeat protein [Robiginitalea sp.]